MALLDAVKSSGLAKLLNAWISQKMGRSLHSPSTLFQAVIDGANSRAGKMERDTIDLLNSAITRFVWFMIVEDQYRAFWYFFSCNLNYIN